LFYVIGVTGLRILVCDMPERKDIICRSWSQVAAQGQKKDPGETGVFFSKKL
jgi:hypothetical protein